MPRDTVNRAYFLEVCKERDLARDRLRQVERERDRLATAIRAHRESAYGTIPDVALWCVLDETRTEEPSGEL